MAQGSLGPLAAVYAQPVAWFSGFRVVIIGDVEQPALDPGFDDVAALLLGIGDTACKYLVPQLGAFFVFAAMIALLLWRPAGLFGRA